MNGKRTTLKGTEGVEKREKGKEDGKAGGRRIERGGGGRRKDVKTREGSGRRKGGERRKERGT